jgi:hypothetical protein
MSENTQSKSITEVRDLVIGDILERADGSFQTVAKLSPYTEIDNHGEVRDLISITVVVIASRRPETFTLFPYDKFWKVTS